MIFPSNDSRKLSGTVRISTRLTKLIIARRERATRHERGKRGEELPPEEKTIGEFADGMGEETMRENTMPFRAKYSYNNNSCTAGNMYVIYTDTHTPQ